MKFELLLLLMRSTSLVCPRGGSGWPQNSSKVGLCKKGPILLLMSKGCLLTTDPSERQPLTVVK